MHITQGQYNIWIINILEWYPRDVKQARRPPQSRWREEIRKKAGVKWMTEALMRQNLNYLGEIYIQQWTEKS